MKVNVVGDLLKDNQLIPTQAVAASKTSDVQPLENLDGCSFQLVTTGTVSLTWKIEVSNDYASSVRPNLGQLTNSGTWTDITSAFTPAITNPSGSATNQYVQAYPLVAKAIRVSWSSGSGAGNVTVTFFGKGNR